VASVADVIVNLGAKTGKFQNGMSRAQRRTQKFNKTLERMKTVLRTVGAALATVGAGIGIRALSNLTREAIRTNDEVGKMSTVIGIATDRLRGLQFAAELSGVSFAELEASFTSVIVAMQFSAALSAACQSNVA